MKRIPVSVLRDIAERYGCSQIVLLVRAGHKPSTCYQIVVTYGCTEADQEVADRLGEHLRGRRLTGADAQRVPIELTWQGRQKALRPPKQG